MNYLLVITGFIALFAGPALAHRGHAPHHGHHISPLGGNLYGSGSMDKNDVSKLTDKQIGDQIVTLITNGTNDDVVKFLSALNTTDGQTVLKIAGIKPTMISDLLKQMNGAQADIAKARESMRNFVQSLSTMTKRQRKSLRQVYQVYYSYLNRQMAKQMLQTLSLDGLTAALTALAAAERRSKFGPISFTALLQTLNTKKDQGRKEVNDALEKWINVTDCRTLKRASKIAAVAVMPFMTTTISGPSSNATVTMSPSTMGPSTNQTIPPKNVVTTVPPPANQTTMRPGFP